jgi:hypothetical protein
MEQYGEKFNSLRQHSLEDVLNHEWFANSLVSSWNSDKKLMTCGRTCGTDYEFSSSTSTNSKLTKFKILTKKYGWIKEGEEHFNEYEVMQ